MRRPLRALLVAVLLACPLLAHALCLGACTCGATVGSVVFAPYNPLQSSHADSTGSVRVTCGGVAGLLIPYTLSFSPGGGGSYAPRRMSAGTNRLNYNLYTSVLYSSVLGDGTSGTSTLSGSILLNVLGIGTADNWVLYGRIPSGQTTAVPGAFTDTLVVTLTYY